MGTGDLWFDTDGNNRPYRCSGTAWVATDDPRIAANAASIQTQSQAIAEPAKMGPRCVDGQSQCWPNYCWYWSDSQIGRHQQVMVSASQFFVFNPNSPNATRPLLPSTMARR